MNENGLERSLEQHSRMRVGRLAIVGAVVVVAFGCGLVASTLGRSTGPDVDAARATGRDIGAGVGATEGTSAGQKAGKKSGATDGVRQGRSSAAQIWRDRSYKLAFAKAKTKEARRIADEKAAAVALEAERQRRLAEQEGVEGGPAPGGVNPGLPICGSGAIGACYDPLTGNVLV